MMELTREQIEDMRHAITSAWWDDAHISALCDLALRGLESQAIVRAALEAAVDEAHDALSEEGDRCCFHTVKRACAAIRALQSPEGVAGILAKVKP